MRIYKPLSPETKEKIRQKHIGKKLSAEHRSKIGEWNRKNGNPMKGKKHSTESKEKQRKKMLGRKLTEEHRNKVIRTLINGERYNLRGERHPNWKGGISSMNARIRSSKEMRIWKRAVWEKDEGRCKFCGADDKKMNADHIKPFALFPELRFAIDNGRLLCVDCHRKTDTFGGRTKNQ